MSFGGLYTSISGIYANKKALDTVSHNISNANNSAYVRQSAIHASNRYSNTQVGDLQIGTGVHVQEIRQIRDEFIDLRIRKELEQYGYWSSTSDILGEVEAIYNEITGSGLKEVMNNFWDSWSELYQEPDSLAKRGVLHESAVAFTETVNHMDTQLDNLQLNLNVEILSEVDDVNNMLTHISQLNEKIKLTEAQGDNVSANDFKDSRNEILDKLSVILPITYYEKYTGEVVVSLQGRDLVNGDYLNLLDIEKDSRGYGYIHWSDTKERIDLQGKGRLGGYIDARDVVVEKYRSSLDTLVSNMADAINAVHKTGKSLDWDPTLPAPEIPFFVGIDGEINAASIKVNPGLSNFNKIAISKSGNLGDGEIAKEIIGLREKIHDSLGNMTFDDYYRDIISSIGVERSKARNMTLNQGTLLKQLEDRKDSISQVSLDEEMTDMLKYQHSYVANSRVINAIDEMIETIVTRMGIVGR